MKRSYGLSPTYLRHAVNNKLGNCPNMVLPIMDENTTCACCTLQSTLQSHTSGIFLVGKFAGGNFFGCGLVRIGNVVLKVC